MIWIAGIGAAAVWAGGMAVPRLRRAGRRRPWIAYIGITTGSAAIASMLYAAFVIGLAPSGLALPAPAHWIGSPVAAATPEADGVGALDSAESAGTAETGEVAPAAPVDPLESERLDLAQSVGTAAYVLDQTAASDGLWPSALAITTDGTTLMSPDGIVLAPIPAGAQVLYSTSSDRTTYSLTMIGPSGVTASVNSATGSVQTSVP